MSDSSAAAQAGRGVANSILHCKFFGSCTYPQFVFFLLVAEKGRTVPHQIEGIIGEKIALGTFLIPVANKALPQVLEHVVDSCQPLHLCY